MAALGRAQRFAENATLTLLKEKLAELNAPTTGAKANLKMRLLEEIQKLNEESLENYFPENVLDRTGSQSSVSGPTVGEENDVDAELESLRGELRKRKEIAELRRQISELSHTDTETASSRQFHFRDVEESLPQFSGDDHYYVQKFITAFEESAQVLGWDNKTSFVYAKRLLTGTAKLFLRTISPRSWNDLKVALLKEFSTRTTSAEIHRKLRVRRKQNDESMRRYILAMQEIASLAAIEEADLVQYIIDGIPDLEQNKLILYNANTVQELKEILPKFERITSAYSHSSVKRPNEGKTFQIKAHSKAKCFNCNELGHMSPDCPKPKRPRGSCFKCGSTGHKAHQCEAPRAAVMSVGMQNQRQYESASNNEFEHLVDFIFGGPNGRFSCSLMTLLDSGSPISFVQQKYLPEIFVDNTDTETYSFCGINGSALCILGKSSVSVNFANKLEDVEIFIVKNETMLHPVVLGRDFLKKFKLKLYGKNLNLCIETETVTHEHIQTGIDENSFEKQILNIDIGLNKVPELHINAKIPHKFKKRLNEIVSEVSNYESNTNHGSDNGFEMHIRLSKTEPFYSTPRRLPYTHRVELQKLIDDLLKQNVITESDSPFASPIVMVRKKSGEFRLCVDYRELNKNTVKDNYPLPVIEDLLDRLRKKKYFSVLDLRNGFHHVDVSPDSRKYTSFVTPIGQYEYLKMPFGLKNAPAVFQRYINNIFKDFIAADKLLVYMDDILIASETLDDHLKALELAIQESKNIL